MNNMNDITLTTQNGEAVTSSRDVAKRFDKQHKHVLDAVKNLVAENSAAKSMFYPATFENRGKSYPMYLMNRDGFSLLAMGFTGKEAVEWKLKYIEAFNAMEQQLARQREKRIKVQGSRRVREALEPVNEARQRLHGIRQGLEDAKRMKERTGAAVAQAKANHTKVCSILRSFEEQEAQAQIQLSKALDLLNLVAAEEALDGPEVLAVLEDMLGPEWAAAALPAANKED